MVSTKTGESPSNDDRGLLRGQHRISLDWTRQLWDNLRAGAINIDA